MVRTQQIHTALTVMIESDWACDMTIKNNLISISGGPQPFSEAGTELLALGWVFETDTDDWVYYNFA